MSMNTLKEEKIDRAQSPNCKVPIFLTVFNFPELLLYSLSDR